MLTLQSAVGFDAAVEHIRSVSRELAMMRDAAVRVLSAAPTPIAADSAFVEFRSSYDARLSELATHMWNDETFNRWLWQQQGDINVRIDSVAALLSEYGLVMAQSEGSVFAAADSDILLAQLGNYLTPALHEYLTIRAREEAAGFSNDAMLLISWDDLADRIVMWEKFLGRTPEFILAGEAEAYHELYLYTYMTGLDNSRIFDLHDGQLASDVRSSYESLVAGHPDTEVAQLIRQYLDVLVAAGFRHDESVREFLEARGIRTMLGVQPPIR